MHINTYTYKFKPANVPQDRAGNVLLLLKAQYEMYKTKHK